VRRSDKPIPNCAALGGTVNRGLRLERLGAPKKPCSAASSPGGPRRDALSVPGSRRRGPDAPVFEEFPTIKCGAERERRPRPVQNKEPKKKSSLPPELKQFIDRVIVPILVNGYLATETSSRKR
jgi:hypothetical protein